MGVNTRARPFTDPRVRRALNYAIDRAKLARLLGQDSHPTCQMLPRYVPGHRAYCPYTLNPSNAGVWRAPNIQKARSLIAASGTRGTPITIWNQPGFFTDFTATGRYLVSLLDRPGYPTRVKTFSVNDTTFLPRVANKTAQPLVCSTRTRCATPTSSQRSGQTGPTRLPDTRCGHRQPFSRTASRASPTPRGDCLLSRAPRTGGPSAACACVGPFDALAVMRRVGSRPSGHFASRVGRGADRHVADGRNRRNWGAGLVPGRRPAGTQSPDSDEIASGGPLVARIVALVRF